MQRNQAVRRCKAGIISGSGSENSHQASNFEIIRATGATENKAEDNIREGRDIHSFISKKVRQ